MNDSALERYDGQETSLAPLPETPATTITPAQARVESVAALLDAAYRNASLLKLTPEEAHALEEPFPDAAFRLGAGGDPSLLYIEHAYLRQRLNKVLGVGAAVPIRRREWAEEFNYWKDGKTKKGVRIYVDLALLVRGCLVGEAIGDAVYYPDNAKTNYSDALESAKSNAFRRCAKEFGVGLQAWMKGWCEGWKERNGAGRTEKTYTVHEHHPAHPNASKGKPEGKVMPSNASSDSDWRTVQIHFGKDSGIPLGALNAGKLRWYQEEWMPRPFNGKISPQDTALREALNASLGGGFAPVQERSRNDEPVEETIP